MNPSKSKHSDLQITFYFATILLLWFTLTILLLWFTFEHLLSAYPEDVFNPWLKKTIHAETNYKLLVVFFGELAFATLGAAVLWVKFDRKHAYFTIGLINIGLIARDIVLRNHYWPFLLISFALSVYALEFFYASTSAIFGRRLNGWQRFVLSIPKFWRNSKDDVVHFELPITFQLEFLNNVPPTTFKFTLFRDLKCPRISRGILYQEVLDNGLTWEALTYTVRFLINETRWVATCEEKTFKLSTHKALIEKLDYFCNRGWVISTSDKDKFVALLADNPICSPQQAPI